MTVVHHTLYQVSTAIALVEGVLVRIAEVGRICCRPPPLDNSFPEILHSK